MDVFFAVLGSGSHGNCAYVEHAGGGFLIDLGLGPRTTQGRLKLVGRSWANVRSVLVTHCHGDHVHGPTLAHLDRHGIPLCLHREGRESLKERAEVARMEKEGRLRLHDGEFFPVARGVSVRPVPVPHDVPTHGFVVEVAGAGGPVRIGYASDLGHVDGRFVEEMADCDLLALEFNHDVEMELASGRNPWVIERVLGPEGHLSNEQAAEGLERILRASSRRVPRDIVLLHLSEPCNDAALALRAARRAVHRLGLAGEVRLHVARQREPGPAVVVRTQG